MTTLLARGTLVKGKEEFHFLMRDGLEDRIYLDHAHALLTGQLFSPSDEDENILASAVKKEMYPLLKGDFFSITNSKGTRTYQFFSPSDWKLVSKITGEINIPELEEALQD